MNGVGFKILAHCPYHNYPQVIYVKELYVLSVGNCAKICSEVGVYYSIYQ